MNKLLDDITGYEFSIVSFSFETPSNGCHAKKYDESKPFLSLSDIKLLTMAYFQSLTISSLTWSDVREVERHRAKGLVFP